MRDTANYLSPAKMQEAIDAVPELGIRKWHDADVQMLLRIMYWCGLRPGEAIGLSKEDFDVPRREVSLGETKTRRHDRAAIPVVFAAELEAYLGGTPGGRLLPGLTYNTFYRWLVRLGRMCSVPAWIVPQRDSGEKTKGHIFRKSVGKDMLDGLHGERARAINIISRHLRRKKPSMTIDYYLRADLATVKEAW